VVKGERWHEKYDEHFFLIATAPRINLKDQTLQRAVAMPGLIPRAWRGKSSEELQGKN